MELRQLRHFLALMKTKSYWRAAEISCLTPQALSKSIRRLEESLGVRLFDRDSRFVRPTLFAELIAAYANNIDAEARSLRRELDGLLGAGTNQIAIGAGAAAATHVIAEAILAVRRKNPRLEVTVMEGTCESLLPQLVHGRLDVVMSILTQDAIDPLIAHTVVHAEQYLVFGRKDHPLSSQAHVPLHRLAEFPWITGLDKDRVADEVRASYAKRGIEPPRAQFRTDSVSFAVGLAQQSDFLFLLPREMVRRDLEAGRLAIIDVDAETWVRPTAIFHRRNSTRSPDSILLLSELYRIVGATEPDVVSPLRPAKGLVR